MIINKLPPKSDQELDREDALRYATSASAGSKCFNCIQWRDAKEAPPKPLQMVLAVDRWANVRLIKWIPGLLEARNTVKWAPVPNHRQEVE